MSASDWIMLRREPGQPALPPELVERVLSSFGLTAKADTGPRRTERSEHGLLQPCAVR